MRTCFCRQVSVVYAWRIFLAACGVHKLLVSIECVAGSVAHRRGRRAEFYITYNQALQQ